MPQSPVTRFLPLFSIAILLAVGSSDVLAQDAKPVFRAGAATSNITPPLGALIVGGWKPIPATNVHDELHARCLVLDDGKVKLAFVLCDNVGIPVEVFDLAKQQVHDTTGLPTSHLLMAATHTHSATTARGPLKTFAETELTDYQQFVARRISDGVRRVLAQLEPARIGWGKIDEPSEVFNRRWFVTDATIPFETFAETGLELKDRSPFGDTFTIELANGSYGYLPTPEQHRLGGYETWLGSNYVEKEATTKIVATLLDLFEALQHDSTNN